MTRLTDRQTGFLVYGGLAAFLIVCGWFNEPLSAGVQWLNHHVPTWINPLTIIGIPFIAFIVMGTLAEARKNR